MKQLLAATAIAFTLATAHADLIDLTPGGFNPGNPPPVFTNWLTQHFQHDAVHIANEYFPGGWDPAFRGPPIFVSTPLGQPTATIAWDLSGISTGPYKIAWIFVGGDGFVNMYQASPDQATRGSGLLRVDGIRHITAVAVYGLPLHDAWITRH